MLMMIRQPGASAPRQRPRPQVRPGFTLIETIAAMSVLALLGSLASMLVMTSVGGFTQSAIAAQLHTEASIALDRIDQAVRDIPRSGSAPGAPDIASITASSITWQTNSSLSLSGSNLMLTLSGGTPRVLLSDVTSFSVQAYDETNTAMAATLTGSACEPVRRVRFAVALQRSGVTHTLRTKVFLRGTTTS
jgi:prepilin-type N-terminal cleavage/methylation domain-containing protein